MDDFELLQGVLDKTGALIRNVDSGQWKRPTPCPDYDVGALIGHMVGWGDAFAAAANGEPYDGDPGAYQADAEAGTQFGDMSARIVAGWRSGGFDRNVRMTGGELPAAMVFNMTLMEYATHGWDLAVATGQQSPFTDQEAAGTLARAQTTLPTEYRGEGKPFGDVVGVSDGATPIEKLAGFMGRRP